MIRVAVVMGKMHSGGKKNLVMEYYRNIDKNLIQFDFICDKDSNSIPREEIEASGGKIFIVEPYQKLFSHQKQLYRIFKENDYKIVHSYNNTLNIFSLFIAKLAGVPVRISESISMAHKNDKKTILKTILKPFSKWFVTDFLANGEECGKWQFGEKLYNEGKIRIFKSAIDSTFNDYNENTRNATRLEYNLSDKLVIGHIGRLTAQKNTIFLIDIFNQIAKMVPNAMLLIIGDGDLRDEMLKKIKNYGIENQVLYLGRREDIQQFYNAMDSFVLPSLYEGLPIVGVEAQCCGLPVFFSSEIPGESSVCEDLGFFIDIDKSPEKWAEVIVEKTLALSQTRRGRKDEVIDNGFDSKTEAVSLQNFYLEKLGVASD